MHTAAHMRDDLRNGRNAYAFCIVWTTIPLISWLLPFIGHMGITDSEGNIYDFQGDRTIGKNNMLFGQPMKYVDLTADYVPSLHTGSDQKTEATQHTLQTEINNYNTALNGVIRHFRQHEHYNFFCNNCHTFVASVLNAHGNTRNMESMVTLAYKIFMKGRYIDNISRIRVYAPLMTIIIATVLLVVLL